MRVRHARQTHRVRRAVGAAAVALALAAGLAGCADDPKDKAFGGGADVPAPPSNIPDLPSLNPSTMPTDLPTGLGTSGGGLSSGGSSGGTYDRPSVQPTYNPNAIGEVVGQDCTYDRTTGRMTYEVDIQNESREMSFRYNFTVVFKVGTSVADRTIATRPTTVTVNAGGERSVNTYAAYSNNNRFVFSCQVTTARKYPTS